MREKAKRVIVGEREDNNNKSPAQKKKKSGPELRCWDLDLCEKGKFDVASLGGDRKKFLSFTY